MIAKFAAALALALLLSPAWALVENRPGVQGSLASDFVAKARPDGYTLMITPASSTLATARLNRWRRTCGRKRSAGNAG